MTIVSPMGQLRPVFADKNGKRLSGGKVYTYEPGTLTPKATYTDALNLIPNTNPIDLDKYGEADIFLNGDYRIRVVDRHGTLIDDYDNLMAWATKRYLDLALSGFASGANKFYPTKAEADADIANIAVNQPVNVGELENGGLWFKGSAESTTLTKAPYDAFELAKQYSNQKQVVQEQYINDLFAAQTQNVENLINQQGVSLQQLDNYYNYLMQRLAQIAVDKGWDASFVVSADGSNQQQINDRIGNKWYEKPLGYSIDDRVMLDNGDIVKSTVSNNTANPNTDMSGWVNVNAASQILDESGLSQQEINNNSFVFTNNITTLKETPILSVMPSTTTRDNNAQYYWNSNSTATVDNYTVIQSNFSIAGRWLLVSEREISVENFVGKSNTSAQNFINAVDLSNRKTIFAYDYEFNDSMRFAADNSVFKGNSRNTLKYTGASGSLGNLKSLIQVRKIGNTAISRERISDLSINMGQADYSIGFDVYYLTSESLVDRVTVNNIADNSIGFKISKTWYAKFRQCFASGYNANVAGRHGTGVLIESLQSDGAQVNAVSMDFRCHTLDTGIHIKPVGYIYGLNMLDMPTIENCNVGIKYEPTSSSNDYSVRQSVISAYFENNGKDIVWGSDATSSSARSSKHTWLSCSFDDVYSTIEIYEGHHLFIGCKGIKNIHVGANAKVRFINSNRPSTITGVTSNIVFEQDPLEFVTAGNYQEIYTKPQGALKLKSTIANGVTTATFDLSVALKKSIASEGQTGLLRVLSRRSYDTTPSVLTAVILRKSSGATVTLTNTPPSSLSATLDAAGILTVTETRTDTRFVDVVFNPD